MPAIFLSVPRALHFAYLMRAYPVTPESIMAKIMRQFVKESEVREGLRVSTVCFDGLTALEVHQQCTNIRDMVVRLLPPPESASVRARFGLTDYHDYDDGERRYFFDRDRTQAIKTLSDWLRPGFDDVPMPMMDLLVGRHYADLRQTPIPIRDVAELFGKSRSTVHRRADEVGYRLGKLETRALDLLTPVFVKASADGWAIAEA
ncbi:hypothetical protein ACS7SF_02775 [Ralstonia sp. 25C]|uniref:hypothetical protein n=1 Tax=Ralstonia sp. 25C TaxID=3447363 RepID=UPI003F74DCB4